MFAPSSLILECFVLSRYLQEAAWNGQEKLETVNKLKYGLVINAYLTF